jgi:CheY-like chemotaxis protein
MDIKTNSNNTSIKNHAKGKPSEQMEYKMLRRVMLVEDDIDDQFFARAELKRAKGVGKVECFSNGKALIQYLHDRIAQDKDFLRIAPTVIILDLNMPLMNGLEALQLVKSDPLLKDVPVIVVTGQQSSWEIEKAFSFKADAVFKKPLDVGKLRKFFEEESQGFWNSLWH